ncbi:hypothetical protein ACQ4PT_036846 [Festuca glaucescens]
MEEEASWLFYCDIDSSSRPNSTKTIEEASGSQGELISASTDDTKLSEIEKANEMGTETAELDEIAEASWLFFYDNDSSSRANSTKTMEEASGGQGELISASTDDTKLSEIKEANEIEEANEGTVMQTGQFLDMGSTIFLANLSKLFSTTYGDDDTTSLSPMHFTHTTQPGDAASVASTLQIFSLKLQEIKEANWPLRVYGTIAARDTVDRNRNILFHRQRDNCQILAQKDPSLQLTGPSRAIVATDPVDFEIQLKVKGRGRKESEDRVLMRQTFVYGGGDISETTLLGNDHCKIMLRCARLENTVQATIVAVRVINWRKRAWPFKHGGKVSCVAKGPIVKPKEEEVVLQDQVTAATTSRDGYLDLSRRVVSVELNGELRVIIRSPKFRGHVFFPAKECKSSRGICHLGPYEVEVTVAWSLLIRDKRCISRMEECVDDVQAFEHTTKGIQRMKATLKSQSATKIYSLLDLISKNAMKLKAEPKLRISDYSISEVQIHMNNMYRDVTSLLRMMENVHNKYGPNALFNGLDQLCTWLDQMGLLSYKRTLKSQSFSELSRETLEAAKVKDEVSPRISSSTDIKLEIEEAKEMGGEDEDSDKTQTEEEYFESYRQGWVLNWSIFCGSFTETTSLSPMHFTHSTPGHSPRGALVDSTLQIYSIKVTNIEDDSGLNWPLQVYGVVAARDTVDRSRNILFSRQRNNCQILTPEDPFLRLTGPSRAIVSEPARVEIELKVKGTTKSEDSVLMSHAWYYSSSYQGLRTLYTPLEGDYCTMVLSAETLGASVQATIVGIRVRVPEGRPNPFEYGGRVVCSSLPRRKGKLPDSEHIAADPSFRQVVLQDGAMATCSKGYLNLARHVVSAKLRGKLELVIEARSRCGAMAGQVVVSIDAQECNITENICHLGDSELEITVAWSRLVEDKAFVSTL